MKVNEIKLELKKRGIDNRELARFCNVSDSMISQFLKGTNYSETVEKAIKKILNLNKIL